MTSDGTMGTANHRRCTLVHRAALSLLTMAAVVVARAEPATPPAPAVTPCDNSMSDQAVLDCNDDTADDRPIQIETMNLQLRMEKRRKDSLLHLYPDEAAHNAARLHDLEEKDRPIRAAENRVEDLKRERRRLGEATGLYAGKRLPAELREQSLRIDTALQGATATLKNCRDEREMVGRNYDEELVVLRRLWEARRRALRDSA